VQAVITQSFNATLYRTLIQGHSKEKSEMKEIDPLLWKTYAEDRLEKAYNLNSLHQYDGPQILYSYFSMLNLFCFADYTNFRKLLFLFLTQVMTKHDWIYSQV